MEPKTFANDQTVQALLDAISETFSKAEDVAFVRHGEAHDLFVVRVADPLHRDRFEFQHRLMLGGVEYRVRIRLEHGPRITFHGYPIQGDPNDPLDPGFPSKPAGSPLIGGDRIANRRGTSWGTLGVAVHGIQMKDSKGNACGTNAACLLSNNHVIALSNGGIPGDAIYDFDNKVDIGNLHCYLPMGPGGVDAALATVFATNVAWGLLSGLWRVPGVIRRPSLGQVIYKAGGRTGTNEGNYMGQANVNVDGIYYRGVGVTSRQFGCKGDSGSLVVDGSSLLGLYFAGEDVPCDQRPHGFFFLFDELHSVTPSFEMQLNPGSDNSEKTTPIRSVPTGESFGPGSGKLPPEKLK